MHRSGTGKEVLGRLATDTCIDPHESGLGVQNMTDGEVKISRSRSQVDQVIRAVRGQDGSLSALLLGLNDSHSALAKLAESPLLEDPKLSRSLLLGLLVLASFPGDGAERRGKDIAELLGMSQTTAHRYITTLTAAGLLERNPRTREYRLAV